jgi:hypothetical protein
MVNLAQFRFRAETLETVMAGLGPAIHDLKDVDPRDKPGDDD